MIETPIGVREKNRQHPDVCILQLHPSVLWIGVAQLTMGIKSSTLFA